VLNEDRIRQMVRRVVYRTLGLPQGSRTGATRPLVTEADVQAVPVGGQYVVPHGALITPLARQVTLERHVTLVETGAASLGGLGQETGPSGETGSAPTDQQTIAIGADHGGYELKEMLKGTLGELGYRVVDCGTDSTSSVDYPDFAFAVAQLVAQGRAWCGIIVDGAGIGSCMAANKVPGVRAAMCYDQATAANSREHNGANVLTLGAGLIGPNLARQIVKTWLETPFGGGRHARRVNKIMEIERRFFKSGE
jgi:ribose 5-phosphate isomerase B